MKLDMGKDKDVNYYRKSITLKINWRNKWLEVHRKTPSTQCARSFFFVLKHIVYELSTNHLKFMILFV